jgi:hypothetical protein
VENLLLVFDEIDDVFSTVGLIWRPVVSFLVAVALFVATGFVFLTFPIVVEVLAVGLVAAGLFESLRQRRLSQTESRDAANTVEQ